MVDRKQWFLLNCLRVLDPDNPLDLSTFEGRLIFQKKVYMLQEFGVPLGYNYGSYIRGPYSSNLTHDGFEISEIAINVDEIDLAEIAPIENDEVFQAISHVRELLDELPDDSDLSYWLELMSSLHFLMNYAYPPVITRENLFERLSIWKPSRFALDDMRRAVELMEYTELIVI